jgi:hypothetical protein
MRAWFIVFVEIFFVENDGHTSALGFDDGAIFGGGINKEINIVRRLVLEK